MAERLVEFFIALFSGSMAKELIVFIISLLPVLELRGGIIAGYALGMSLLPSFVIAYIGNMLPIPFVLLAIKAIFKFLKKTPFKGIAYYFENKAMSKSEQVQRLGYLGLFLFVAIPLPGTGAWTGSLVATLLDLDFKKSFIVIAFGVLTAGIIVSIFSFGLLNAIGIG
jgi:uncharacterized membrane protein